MKFYFFSSSSFLSSFFFKRQQIRIKTQSTPPIPWSTTIAPPSLHYCTRNFACIWMCSFSLFSYDEVQREHTYTFSVLEKKISGLIFQKNIVMLLFSPFTERNPSNWRLSEVLSESSFEGFSSPLRTKAFKPMSLEYRALAAKNTRGQRN